MTFKIVDSDCGGHGTTNEDIIQRHVGWKFTAVSNNNDRKQFGGAFRRNRTSASSRLVASASQSTSSSSTTIPYFYALMIEKVDDSDHDDNDDIKKNDTNPSIAEDIKDFAVRLGGMKAPGWMVAMAAAE
mmetsp:Transcript_40290/g.97299  ORF Transcript_40290/g.97299 Transcript_40290/m.97299 type:complete len:130 (+) Transcript_40290:411-800(+)